MAGQSRDWTSPGAAYPQILYGRKPTSGGEHEVAVEFFCRAAFCMIDSEHFYVEDGGASGRYDKRSSRSSRLRVLIRLVSAVMMESARSRLVFCSSSTFSSTVSRAMIR